MARKMIDCRQVPNEIGCTLTIAGGEEEVLDAATAHAVAKHGHQDTPSSGRCSAAGCKTPSQHWHKDREPEKIGYLIVPATLPPGTEQAPHPFGIEISTERTMA